ncbi:FkbM family methyltransferase [Xanthobacter tagetidis]|uniref:FkbM family methyltransferase n=1 Tax=Xanthobacter tagetidis TaxID=60216 RepID=UPI0014755F6C|nr:FkbM family methyltransferase [Xanthobacter tagetidis]MBB6309142.1 FkbM family methyltransferase [Xanthobacter tagetidis]
MDYEAMLETFYRGLDLTNQLVVDVGGHVGRHAFPLSELVGGNGTVFIFEPLPQARHQLYLEIISRGVVNAVVFPFALSSTSGITDFFYIPNLPGESGLKERAIYNDVPSDIIKLSVATRRLDDLVPSSMSVAFLKIDAEGGELDILRGAATMIGTSRPIVAFECGAASFLSYHDTPEDIFEIFAANNYSVFSITGTLVDDHESFRTYSHAQHFWDYIAIPNEKRHLADSLIDH